MAFYDREEERTHLLAEYGVPMMLGRSLEEAKAERCVTHWAFGCFRTMVRAALCGLDAEAQSLLVRAHDWLDVACDIRERPSGDYSKHWTEAQRLRTFGLCRWLKDRSSGLEWYSLACDEIDKYLRRERDKTEVAYNMPSFLLAKRFKDLTHHFKNCERLDPPTRLKGIKCPGKISYLFATHALDGTPDDDALKQAFESFLKHHIPVCLGVRRGGFGIIEHIPIWTHIEEMNFGGMTADGFDNIRRSLAYVQIAASP